MPFGHLFGFEICAFVLPLPPSRPRLENRWFVTQETPRYLAFQILVEISKCRTSRRPLGLVLPVHKDEATPRPQRSPESQHAPKTRNSKGFGTDDLVELEVWKETLVTHHLHFLGTFVFHRSWRAPLRLMVK